MFLFDTSYADRNFELKRFIRLSPIIHTDKNTLPTVLSLINTLYDFDMKPRENELINIVGHAIWKKSFDDWLTLK